MRVRGIHHLGVAVTDLEEAIATYERLFHARLERGPDHLLAHQAQHVKRALAVPREHDRIVGIDRGDEEIERLRNVAVGQGERLCRLVPVGQEGTEHRLAVARRPHLVGRAERARHAAQEQPCALFGIEYVMAEQELAQLTGVLGARVDVADAGQVQAHGRA